MPFALIPFLLLIVPVVEIATFILIGDKIGLWPTLGMIFVTALVGTFLLRIQGFQLLNRIKEETNSGKIPGRALGDGAMILVAGILLLTPGFVTDTIGFSLFIPFVRSAIWSFIASRITVVMPGGTTFSNNNYESPRDNMDAEGPIIDLEEDEYRTGESDPDSPWNRNSPSD
jgi:UPF0716 protein FxsA